MSIITTGSFPKALQVGVHEWYGESYAQYPIQYTDLFETLTSEKAFEEDVGVSGMGLASVVAEGSGISYATKTQGFTKRYTHIEYGLGFIITRNMIKDNQYMQIAMDNSKDLARSLRQTKETIAANVYNRATTSGYTGADGIVLLSTAHVNVAGGTFSNKLTTDADLSEASLEQAVIDIGNLQDDAGLKAMIKPKDLILPWALQFDAFRILKSVGQPDTLNNNINALRERGVFKAPVINNFLTDTDAWFIRTDCPKGMRYFEREADNFDNDNDYETRNAKFRGSFRCSFGWSDPRGLYGSVGA